MKVLTIHNFHRTGSASGDDQVYINEAKLLQEHGVEVVKYNVNNDTFDNANFFGKLCATLGMVWSFKHYNGVKNMIKSENPDIVHVHTFFPLLSPSILYAAKRTGVKVVATLHDTRFVCPCATSLRENVICNECGDGKYFRMCKYNCFKGSRVMSFFVACVFKYHRWRNTFYNQIDKYICLNDTQINLLTDIGFDKNKVVKKYNFVDGVTCGVFNVYNEIAKKKDNLPNRYVVYFGRLGAEKGIHTLIKVWDILEDIPLVIVGSGPLEGEIRQWAEKKANVYFVGYKNHDECLSIARDSEFTVFPSIWYEGCSMVEIESQMMGKPIIASDIGFSRELIKNGVNGYLVPIKDHNAFAQKIKELWYDKESIDLMGQNSRVEFENNFERESNYLQLKRIYEELIRK